MRDWCQMVSRRIQQQGKAVPALMQPRLNDAFTPTSDHWLDSLHSSLAHCLETYNVNAQSLEEEAQIPLLIFEQGLHWQGHGRQVVMAFQKLLKQCPGDFDQVQMALCRQHDVTKLGMLLGAAAHIYSHGLRDSLLWLLDLADGQPGHGRAWLEALRTIGLIGEAVYTKEGAIRFYAEPVDVGVPVRLNGVWFNLSANETVTCMSQLQPGQAQQMKRALEGMSLVNKALYTEVLDNGRVITRTHDGRLFGYVQAGQELRLLKKDQWVIRHTAVHDGNVHAIVT